MSGPEVCREPAVELFLQLRRAGEESDPDAFAARHPHLEPDLSSALDALLALSARPGRTVASISRSPSASACSASCGRSDAAGWASSSRRSRSRWDGEWHESPSPGSGEPFGRARFRREAELASRSTHPASRRSTAAGVEDERPGNRDALVEGQTLAKAISAARREDASCVRFARAGASGREAALAVARLLAKVARALHAATSGSCTATSTLEHHRRSRRLARCCSTSDSRSRGIGRTAR